MKIAFYVSDYGYGHATRTIRTIEKSLKLFDNLEYIVISGTNQVSIMQTITQASERIQFRTIHNIDAGLVLDNMGLIDKKSTFTKINDWLTSWDEWLKNEITIMIKQNIEIIFTDISPLPIALAKRLNIKAIGISNFTWADQYAKFLDVKSLQHIQDTYNQMDIFLKYPLAMPMEWLNMPVIKLNQFWSIPSANPEKVATIKKKLDNDKKTIFIGFGKGYQNSTLLNLSSIDANFILASTSGNVIANSPIQLKHGDNHYEYMAASDLIISKAGWGTINEAISANIPIYIIKRDIPEDIWTIGQVELLGHGKGVEFSDLTAEIKNFIAQNTL